MVEILSLYKNMQVNPHFNSLLGKSSSIGYVPTTNMPVQVIPNAMSSTPQQFYVVSNQPANWAPMLQSPLQRSFQSNRNYKKKKNTPQSQTSTPQSQTSTPQNKSIQQIAAQLPETIVGENFIFRTHIWWIYLEHYGSVLMHKYSATKLNSLLMTERIMPGETYFLDYNDRMQCTFEITNSGSTTEPMCAVDYIWLLGPLVNTKANFPKDSLEWQIKQAADAFGLVNNNINATRYILAILQLHKQNEEFMKLVGKYIEINKLNKCKYDITIHLQGNNASGAPFVPCAAFYIALPCSTYDPNDKESSAVPIVSKHLAASEIHTKK